MPYAVNIYISNGEGNLSSILFGILRLNSNIATRCWSCILKKKSKKCVVFTSQILGLDIFYIFLFCYFTLTWLNTRFWLIHLHGMGKTFMLNTNLPIWQSGLLLTFLFLYGGVSTFLKCAKINSMALQISNLQSFSDF